MKIKNPSNSKINDGENVAPLLQQTSNQLGVFPTIMKML
jgi:hypothetical protein